MRSRGGETGGLTIIEALALYERKGFTGQFAAREGGCIKCFTCGSCLSARDVSLHQESRVEGVSDPDDMAVVAALTCGSCGARGTATFGFGPQATPEDAEALRLLHDDRGDRPTGWRRAPPDLPSLEQAPEPVRSNERGGEGYEAR